MSLKAEYVCYDLGKADYAVAAANNVAQGEGLSVDSSLFRTGLYVRY